MFSLVYVGVWYYVLITKSSVNGWPSCDGRIDIGPLFLNLMYQTNTVFC